VPGVSYEHRTAPAGAAQDWGGRGSDPEGRPGEPVADRTWSWSVRSPPTAGHGHPDS